MNRKKATLSMILVLTLATILATIPLTNAQPPRKKTYAFMGLIPDTVGVGQETLLHFGIFTPTANLNYHWELTVTLTRPDGTTQTLGPFQTDSTGGTGTSFIPDQVGTYTFQSHFPEQVNPVTFFEPERGHLHLEGTIMEESHSELATLTVTEELQPIYPPAPLPTEYWSRPIDGQYREWYTIAGNWLGAPLHIPTFAPHNDGPETAHILWTKPISTGGLAGGDTGENAWEGGDAYEGKFQDGVIMNGVLYYNRYMTPVLGVERSFVPVDGIIAVDLRTGEKLWEIDDTRLDFGQTLNWDAFNFHGVYDYLWNVQGSTWNAYDPFTGDWLWGMTDVPAGMRYTGPNGEFLIVVADYTNGWMALWNQTACGQQNFAAPGDTGSWERFILGTMHNGSTPACYTWNVTIPTGLAPANIGFFGSLPTVVDDRVLGINISPTRDALTLWAISLKPGQEGQLIFNNAWTPPAEWQAGINTVHYVTNTAYGDGGVCVVWNKELRQHHGFSLDTGQLLWTSEPEHYLQAYGWGSFEHSWIIAYDKLYTTGVSGYLYCYDVHTGEKLWTYEAEDPYGEFLFSTNWWGRIPFITDGKVYLGHAEHSPLDPKPRGAPFVCLDAETGDIIWKVDGMFRQTHWGGRAIIGDSIMATMDTYDSRIYAVGKGPSQTTVEAPKAGIPQGSSVVICGTVMDISAGTTSAAVAARFPNGVPAVADESMSDWMLYVYKQSEFPVPHPYGVDVSIDVIDANGNFRNIGTASTDASGFYSLEWTPDIYGKYTVIATFPGSEGYYASYAEAAFVVDQAPDPTPPPEPTPPPTTDATLMGLGIAAVVAIIVFGLLILLMLRKR